MKLFRITKVNIPLLILTLVSLFAIAATKAYFTASANSPESVFLSGSLTLDIIQDSVLSVSNWQPGDIHTMEFAVTNTGDVPVYIKGFLAGTWDATDLDQNMVEILAIERLTQLGWDSLTPTDVQMGSEFFIGTDGNEVSVEAIQPQQTETVRVSVRLSEQTPDEYQGKSFTTALHLAAKQVLQGASWPSSY